MKIGAFSDIHLGAFGERVDPATGMNAGLVDRVATLRRILTEMDERGVDVILFAGDAFKVARPVPTLERLFGDEIRRFAGRQVYAVLGNHDNPRSVGERHAMSCLEWNAGFVVDRQPQLRTIGTGGDIVQLITLPYPAPQAVLICADEYRDLPADEVWRRIQAIVAGWLRNMAERLDPQVPSILVGHIALDLAEAGSERNYMLGRDMTIPLAWIPDQCMYVLLGHVHRPQEVLRMGRTGADAGDFVYVLGSTDAVDHSEDGEEKRWLFIDTEAGVVESVPTGARRYTTVTVDVRDGKCETAGTYRAGDVVRLKVLMRHGQDYDLSALRREYLDAGAYSVRVVTEVEREDRLALSSGSSLSDMSYEQVFCAYCEQRGIAGERANELIRAALAAMAEANDDTATADTAQLSLA